MLTSSAKSECLSVLKVQEAGDSELAAVSLFSNCGAGDLGYSLAGFRFLVLAELEPRRLEVAMSNHLSAFGIGGDIREKWPLAADIFEKTNNSHAPDLLAACPPCQGMSTARSGRGAEHDPEAGSKDERNLLVIPISETAARLRPRIVVVENVQPFFSRRVRSPFNNSAISAAALLSQLLGEHYVAFPLMVDLAEFGVPQSRKRAFITFIRRNEPCLDFLEKENLSPYPTPIFAKEYGGNGPISLKSALESFGLPKLDARTKSDASDPNRALHCVPVWSDRQYRMIAEITPNSGKSAWENKLCLECGRVQTGNEDATCHACGNPLPRPVVTEGGDYRLVRGFRRSSYRRLDPEKPAATITTASGRVGSDRTIHPWENRVLSVLECAMLQTFPATFRWGRSSKLYGDLSLRAMIGEAVPPLFTFLHGSALRQLLDTGSADRLISSSNFRCRKALKKLESGAK